MELKRCRRCGHPMTRIITQTIEPGGSRWKACYTCLSCGHKIVAAPAKSRTEAEKGLEDFAAMIDQEYKTTDTRSAAPRKPQTAETDRALNAYGLYCQLCEAMTGKPIAKLDELLTAALHRAEPGMRPLTLEEVLELGKDEDSIVYIESRRFCGCGWYQPCSIICDSSEAGQKNEIHFYEPGNNLPEFWPEAEYGKSWRCWPRKPTPEQLAAEKWEE